MEFAGVNGNSPHARQYRLDGNSAPHRLRLPVERQAGDARRLRQYIVNPNNDWMQTAGFSNNTSLVNSNDGGRTPIQGVMNNPFPNGINAPTGSSLGASDLCRQEHQLVQSELQSAAVDTSSRSDSNTRSARPARWTFPTWATASAHNQSNFPFDVNPNYLQCSVMYGANAGRLCLAGGVLQPDPAQSVPGTGAVHRHQHVHLIDNFAQPVAAAVPAIHRRHRIRTERRARLVQLAADQLQPPHAQRPQPAAQLHLLQAERALGLSELLPESHPIPGRSLLRRPAALHQGDHRVRLCRSARASIS